MIVRAFARRTLLLFALFAGFGEMEWLDPSNAATQIATVLVPVPRVVIYPGDVISRSMLTEAPAASVGATDGMFIEDPSQIIGKAAQRTLLPGQAILKYAVANPRAVRNGSQVVLFYSTGGLEISTTAMALQDGSVGDLIRVRNDDSGLIVSGVVQKNGTVRVSGG